MDEIVVVASCERTGTHFTAGVCSALTGKRGAWVSGIKREEYTRENVGVLVTHVYYRGFSSHSDAVIEAMVEKGGCPCVVPIREPIAAFISKRERKREPLDSVGLAKSMVRIAGWDNLHGIHFFQIDPPEDRQQAEIDRLARFLGTESVRLKAWRPLNAQNPRLFSGIRHRRQQGEDILAEFAEELEILEPVRPFFERFGYSW